MLLPLLLVLAMVLDIRWCSRTCLVGFTNNVDADLVQQYQLEQ